MEDKKFTEGIGKRLKTLRKELNISQGAFAEKIGLKQGSYSDIENEKEPLIVRNFEIICYKFKVNEDWLRYGGDVPMFSESSRLNPDERELLEIYERLIPECRKEVRIFAAEKLELQELREKASTNTHTESGQEADFNEKSA
jgi:transcriptional regulator with XRE-family HTH domain